MQWQHIHMLLTKFELTSLNKITSDASNGIFAQQIRWNAGKFTPLHPPALMFAGN